MGAIWMILGLMCVLFIFVYTSWTATVCHTPSWLTVFSIQNTEGFCGICYPFYYTTYQVDLSPEVTQVSKRKRIISPTEHQPIQHINSITQNLEGKEPIIYVAKPDFYTEKMLRETIGSLFATSVNVFNILQIVLLSRSTWPSPIGWYGVVFEDLMPVRRCSSLNRLLLNSAPWSWWILSGYPNCIINSLNSLSAAVLLDFDLVA